MQKQKPNSRRVIARANLPMRMPLWHSLVLYLFLDHIHAPGWVWGAMGLFLLICWGIWFWALFTDINVNVLANRADGMSPSDAAYERDNHL